MELAPVAGIILKFFKFCHVGEKDSLWYLLL